MLEFIPVNKMNVNVNNVTYTGVVNLSDHNLSDGELCLLSKGLTFIDTPPPPDPGILAEDLSKFHLSIRRKLALETAAGTFKPAFSSSKFKNPSNWNPQGPAILEHMCLLNQTELEQSDLTPTYQRNITKAESEAKTSLKNNSTIVIKKADKGSAVVVQNRCDYISEGLRQLNDPSFYQEKQINLTAAHNDKVRTKVTEMLTRGEISQKTADYLVLQCPRTAKFYLLPKIHTNKTPPPGRPIVSANDCPTERISEFVEHFINPMVPKLLSYLRTVAISYKFLSIQNQHLAQSWPL